MVNIRKVECPKNKISLKCPYSMTPEFVVIHNTANDAPAKNEISYMHSNNDTVSFHFAVDDKEIKTVSALRTVLSDYRSGNAIRVKYSRNGTVSETVLILDEYAPATPRTQYSNVYDL
jgi:N-acetylmuramoyl-L-alanine amidase CwlA